MTVGPPLPLSVRRRAATRLLRRAIRHPRAAAEALRTMVAIGGGRPTEDVYRAVLDEALAHGDRSAARARLLEPSGPPGSAAAIRRARALEVFASGLPADRARAERAVATFLRQRPSSRETAGRGPAGAAAEASAAAGRLRAEGHDQPAIVLTLSALEGNPYTELMEQRYEAHALAPVHVDTLADAAAVVAAREAGGYGAVLLVNASNRLIWSTGDDAAAMAAARSALATLDEWRAAGVPLVVSVHDGPILRPIHAEAEQAIAQGIADRAAAVHLLTASTPAALGSWITLDPARSVHIPIPNYDGIYGPPPDRAGARASLGVDPRDPADAGPGSEILVGMIGLLSSRKGPRLLVDALARVPDPLPDGRRLRLLLAGRVIEPGGEDLIRAAYADRRLVPRFGFVPDDRMPALLAALDVAVVPYRRFLNSSWLSLALTASIPAIAPAGGMAAETVRPGALLTFEGASVASLAAALARSGELVTPLARSEARASVADLASLAISDRFAELLRGVVDSAG